MSLFPFRLLRLLFFVHLCDDVLLSTVYFPQPVRPPLLWAFHRLSPVIIKIFLEAGADVGVPFPFATLDLFAESFEWHDTTVLDMWKQLKARRENILDIEEYRLEHGRMPPRDNGGHDGEEEVDEDNDGEEDLEDFGFEGYPGGDPERPTTKKRIQERRRLLEECAELMESTSQGRRILSDGLLALSRCALGSSFH